MNADLDLLTPYQQRWVSDQEDVKVCEKSRRIGLSWAEAADDALLASSQEGMDVWYIGYSKDMAQEFIRDAAFWAKHYDFAASEVEEEVLKDGDKDILTYKIRFASGYKITALSSRPSNLRGKQGKIVIDEAGFHPDLAGLLKAALAMLVWGGRVVVISTHNGVDSEFNELITDIRTGAKDLDYSLHRITLDDALADGLFKRICLVRRLTWSKETELEWRNKLIKKYGDGADEELFCIPAKGDGNYFSSTLIEARMSRNIPIIHLAKTDAFEELSEEERRRETENWCEIELKPHLDQLDKNLNSFFGEDFGRDVDLTVLVPLIEQRDLHKKPPFAVELRNIPFHQQEQIVFYIIDRLPNFRAGAFDARGNGQYIAEVTRLKYGSDIIFDVKATQDWYRENMPKYKAALQEGNTTLPKDADVLRDHQKVILEKGVPKIGGNHYKGADGQSRHGDFVIGMCMAWFASVQDVIPIPRKPKRRFRRLFS